MPAHSPEEVEEVKKQGAESVPRRRASGVWVALEEAGQQEHLPQAAQSGRSGKLVE